MNLLMANMTVMFPTFTHEYLNNVAAYCKTFLKIGDMQDVLFHGKNHKVYDPDAGGYGESLIVRTDKGVFGVHVGPNEYFIYCSLWSKEDILRYFRDKKEELIVITREVELLTAAVPILSGN